MKARHSFLMLLAVIGLMGVPPRAARSDVPPGTFGPNDLLYVNAGGIFEASALGDLTLIGSDGTPKGTFFSPGGFSPTGFDTFYGPEGAPVLGPDGYLYVCVPGGDGKVVRCDPRTGAPVNVFASGLGYPLCIAFMPDGYAYVGGTTNGNGSPMIARVNAATGEFVNWVLGSGSYGPAPAEILWDDDPALASDLSPNFHFFTVVKQLIAGADGKLYAAIYDDNNVGSAWQNLYPRLLLHYDLVPGQWGVVDIGNGGSATGEATYAIGPDGGVYCVQVGGPLVKLAGPGQDPVVLLPGEITAQTPQGSITVELAGRATAFAPNSNVLWIDGLSADTNQPGYMRYDIAAGAVVGNFVPTADFPWATFFNRGLTQTGANVAVAPAPTATLTFSAVSAAGQTAVTPLSTATASLPANFQIPAASMGLGAYFDVTTTASFSGPVTLGFTYDAAQFPYDPVTNPAGARPSLLHFTGGQWVDITTSIDTTAHKVYGQTTSFSPFAVARKLDVTPPVITAPGTVSAVATSSAGATVNFTASATDDFDGPVPVSYSQRPGTQFPLGTTTVTVTAHDQAGNVATTNIQVVVTCAWSGVLQPMNADGSSVFKAGSTVPVKFQLTGASAGITDAVARLDYAQLNGADPGPVNEADSTSAATAGNLFRYTGGQYLFNWSTKGLSKGKYRLFIDLGDGAQHTVDLGLKQAAFGSRAAANAREPEFRP